MTTTIKKKKAAKEALKETGFAALGSLQNPETYEVPMDLVSWTSALGFANQASETGDERLGRDASSRMNFTALRNWSPFGLLIEKPVLSEDAVYFEIRSALYDAKAEQQVIGAVRRCKLLDNRGTSYQPLLQKLTKAFQMAEANEQYLIVDTSAYGKWKNEKWFDSAIVRIVNKDTV
jgi:hypothetical protein